MGINVNVAPDIMRKFTTRLLGTTYAYPWLFSNAQVTYGINVYQNPPTVPLNDRCELIVLNDTNAGLGHGSIYTVPANKILHIIYLVHRGMTAAKSYAVYFGKTGISSMDGTQGQLTNINGLEFKEQSMAVPIPIPGGYDIMHYAEAGGNSQAHLIGWLEDAY